MVPCQKLWPLCSGKFCATRILPQPERTDVMKAEALKWQSSQKVPSGVVNSGGNVILRASKLLICIYIYLYVYTSLSLSISIITNIYIYICIYRYRYIETLAKWNSEKRPGSVVPGPVSQLGGARKRSQPDVAHLSEDPQDESWDAMPNSYC